jgi:hypothetical protein
MLIRDDLKQYTSEAWAALVIMVLVARIENQWSTRRLVAVGGFSVGALLVSNTGVFVGVAGLLAVGLQCLVERQYRRLGAVAAVLASTLATGAAYYAVVLRPHVTSPLQAFWTANYIPRDRGFTGAIQFVWSATAHLGSYVAFPGFVLDAVLVIAGMAALVARRRLALAAMVPLVYAVVVGASGLRRYPLGDVRTSTFWLVLCSALAAAGLADVVHRMSVRLRPAA